MKTIFKAASHKSARRGLLLRYDRELCINGTFIAAALDLAIAIRDLKTEIFKVLSGE